MSKPKYLNGCVSKNGKEIDGMEFAVLDLKELIEILQEHKSVHLTYFDDEKDLDLWITLED